MADDVSKGNANQPKVSSGTSTGITVIITVLIALLTSLIAPYLLESLKEKQAQRDKEAEKQERIIHTQFEIVESCNEIYWKYREAANFVIFDLENGQPDGILWERHWSNFQKISEEANSQLPILAFRGRMYFGSAQVYQRLLNIPREIFAGVDRDISSQLKIDSIPGIKKGKSIDAWKSIQRKLDELDPVIEDDLNYVFAQIGARANQESTPEK